MECSQAAWQSSFSVGGSSAHSFYICVSPETLVSEVEDLDLIPPLTEAPRPAATAVEECNTSYQVIYCYGWKHPPPLLVRHVSGYAKD